jgi:hypothetical protein
MAGSSVSLLARLHVEELVGQASPDAIEHTAQKVGRWEATRASSPPDALR